MKELKTLIVLTIVHALSFIPCTIFAQGIKVKEMKQVLSDLSGSVHQRMDSLGNPCGLVKVMIENPDVSFDGNVVGDVANKMNEYWVYLPKGTKGLSVKRKNYLPMSICFADYGVNEVESKVTYQMVLKEVSFKKNSIFISISPNYARLTIDNYLIDVDSNGVYEFFLDKGEYMVKAEANGFRKYVNVIEIGKNNDPLTIILESLLADVTISTETNGADVSINDKKVGVGTWVGHLPAGSYTISSYKEGYEPYLNEIHIAEKEKVDIKIPQLKQRKGSINIVSNITDYTDVKVDGKDSEIINGQIVNVTSGKHVITLGKYGYGSVDIPIDVKGDNKDTIKHIFTPMRNYEKAIQGDGRELFQAVWNCCQGKDYRQAFYWFDQAKGHMHDFYEEMEQYSLPTIYPKNEPIRDYSFIMKAKEFYIDIINLCNDEISKCNKKLYTNSFISFSLSSIGNLYKANEKYEEAILWYKKCWDFNHDDSYYFDYCINAGDCNLKLGKIEEAKLWYSRVIDSRSDILQEEAKKKLRLLNYEY